MPRNSLFKNWCWNNIHIEKNEHELLPHNLYKINSKLVKNLNVGAKIIKHLEENLKVNLPQLVFYYVFLDITPKPKQQKKDQ